jgi:hypothetical protein
MTHPTQAIRGVPATGEGPPWTMKPPVFPSKCTSKAAWASRAGGWPRFEPILRDARTMVARAGALAGAGVGAGGGAADAVSPVSNRPKATRQEGVRMAEG